MRKTLNVRVQVKPLPLSRASAQALARLERYDRIVFTSKHAQRLFLEALRARKLSPPARGQTLRVGPRKDLLRYEWRGTRVLFPRSALAPSDIVRSLRARGARVRALLFYTAFLPPLSPAAKRGLLAGSYGALSFRSQSGVFGLLAQLSSAERRAARALPARCIGPATAAAARTAGFKKILMPRV